MKAMILAAGLGTRLKPFTDHHPKALALVNGKSLLEHNILNLQRFGIYDIVVNVHHFADQIIQALSDNNGYGSRYQISNESDAVLETGGGVKFANSLFENDENILVCNADILSNIDLSKMLAHHTSSEAAVTLAVQDRQTSRKLLFNELNQLKGWINIEQKITKPSTLSFENLEAFAFSGIQIMHHSFYNHITLEGKFSLIDAYLDMMASHKIIAYDHTDDLLLDVGKPDALSKAQTLFQ